MSSSGAQPGAFILHVGVAGEDGASRVAAALRACGPPWRIRTCPDVYRALARLQAAGGDEREHCGFPCGLVVRVDGLEPRESEFFEWVRRLHPALPVYVYADSGQQQLKIEMALRAGATGVIDADSVASLKFGLEAGFRVPATAGSGFGERESRARRRGTSGAKEPVGDRPARSDDSAAPRPRTFSRVVHLRPSAKPADEAPIEATAEDLPVSAQQEAGPPRRQDVPARRDRGRQGAGATIHAGGVSDAGAPMDAGAATGAEPTASRAKVPWIADPQRPQRRPPVVPARRDDSAPARIAARSAAAGPPGTSAIGAPDDAPLLTPEELAALTRGPDSDPDPGLARGGRPARVPDNPPVAGAGREGFSK
jgi:hypothetical protein